MASCVFLSRSFFCFIIIEGEYAIQYISFISLSLSLHMYFSALLLLHSLLDLVLLFLRYCLLPAAFSNCSNFLFLFSFS